MLEHWRVDHIVYFQDEASPAALSDLCLTYVSQNLGYFCRKRPDGSLCFREAVHFPQELADQLLSKMATEGKYFAQCYFIINVQIGPNAVYRQYYFIPTKPLFLCFSLLGLLNDSTVGVFRSCDYLRLRRACIRTARISAEAFQRALCPHRLLELDAARVNADLTIPDILQGLATNKYCQASIQKTCDTMI